MRRVGIFGGSFSPPHIGHLICAQSALIELELDEVIFVPARVPPHKELEDNPGPEHRLEMCRLAISSSPANMSLSTLEIDRLEPSYTSTTLSQIGGSLGKDADLMLIVGADMAMTLPQWHEPDQIASRASIAIADRGDVSRQEITAALQPLDARVRFFAMPRVDVSSSLIRHRIREGLPIDFLLPERVVDYIARFNLYRPAKAVAHTHK